MQMLKKDVVRMMAQMNILPMRREYTRTKKALLLWSLIEPKDVLLLSFVELPLKFVDRFVLLKNDKIESN